MEKNTVPKSSMNFTIVSKCKKSWIECTHLNKMESSKEKIKSLGNS
jgi:hypothetical protein